MRRMSVDAAVALVVMVAMAVVSAVAVAPARPGPVVPTAAEARSGGMFVFERGVWGGRGRSAIYVANPDGTGVRRLTSPYNRAGDAAWSPDGSKIAYVTSANPRGIVMNADGSGKRPLCRDSLCVGWAVVGDPAWSPDGRQIAFGRGSGVGIVNADGSGLRFVPNLRWFSVNGLDWSPDGNQFAFGTGSSWRQDGQIRVVNVNGSGFKLIARHALNPRWSSDGKTLLFTKDDGTGIYVVRATGGTPRLIRTVPKTAPVWDATWSSQGTEIAFFQGHDLHVLRLSDRRERIVTLRPAVCRGNRTTFCLDVVWQPTSPPR